MNDSRTDDPPQAPATVPELSASELRLERERCALDMERLALERERLETERMRLERERELYGSGGSNALHVGLWVLALAVFVTLALGLLFGYTAGVDSGRSEVPPPRKVLVSSEFIRALRTGADDASRPAAPSEKSRVAASPWFTLYSRPASDAAFGNLVLVR